MPVLLDHASSMTDGWQAVADAVRARRTALGLRQDDMDGVSPASMARIENAVADNYRGLTLRRLERALGWAPGSIDSIRQGGEAQVLDLGEARHDLDMGVEELYSSVEQLAGLVTRLEGRVRDLEAKLDRRDEQALRPPVRGRR